jgi:LPS-assembly lipoprotein
MSWHDPSRRIVMFGLVAGLAGCGFQPLYGRMGDADANVVGHMAAIRIGPIPDRSGQLLRNALQDKLTPRGRPGKPLYRLDVSLTENRSDLVILHDATSTLAKLRVGANYVLIDVASSRPLTRGVSKSTTVFNIVESQFANINAQADARARAVNAISDNIRLRLGLFFKQRQAS